jgi:glycosyltransferase involved in cell wall biosynthesis
VIDFCDRIIICDNYSTDKTWSIIQCLAQEFTKIELMRVKTAAESHNPIEKFTGTDTWILGLDGDEIYDPVGLISLRKKILAGEFNKDFILFGNVLNCTSLDIVNRIAKGHLAPPCRSMTKLFNFAAIESWNGCSERLHGGQIVFRHGYHNLLRHMYHEEHVWNESDYRCLHTVFLKRSSAQGSLSTTTRISPTDMRDYQISRNLFFRIAKYLFALLQMAFHFDSKYKKYHRGPEISVDIAAFFPKK